MVPGAVPRILLSFVMPPTYINWQTLVSIMIYQEHGILTLQIVLQTHRMYQITPCSTFPIIIPDMSGIVLRMM